jgi:hypothetical protein
MLSALDRMEAHLPQASPPIPPLPHSNYPHIYSQELDAEASAARDIANEVNREI